MITAIEKRIILDALKFRKNLMLTGNPEGNSVAKVPELNPKQQEILAEIEHVTTRISDIKENGEFYRVLEIISGSQHEAAQTHKIDEDSHLMIVQGDEKWYLGEEFFEKMGEVELYLHRVNNVK